MEETGVMEIGCVSGVDLDARSVPFLVPIIPGPMHIENYETKFHPTMKELLDLSQEYLIESKKPFMCDLVIQTSQTTRYDKPILNFVKKEFDEELDKINDLKQQFYVQRAQILFSISIYLTESKKQEIPILFDIDGFKEATNKEFDADLNIKKELKRLNCLASFAQRKVNHLKNSSALDKMREKLSASAEKIDQLQEFSPYGAFDSAFEDFVEWSRTIQRFDLCVKRIIDNLGKKTINMREIDHVNKSFNMLFQPKNADERVVTLFAVTRVLFDQISLVPNFFLFSEEGSDLFVKKCMILKKKTPKELLIAQNLMKEEMMDVPFEDIVKNSKELTESVQNLNSLHFFTNPYDIVVTAFRAVKLIDNFVLANMGKDVEHGSMMSFDDVFSFFGPMMAIDPPKNCAAIAKFLSGVEGLAFSSALDFAKLLICSSVDYIKNLDFNEEII